MSERSAKGCIFAAILWCAILGILAVGYKFLVHPYFSKKLKAETGSSSSYQHEVIVAADSFSGYAVLRSPALKEELKRHQIRLTVRDDKADYGARLKALQAGEVQLATFTIDSLITAGAKAGDFPGTIVLILDETKGGDAIVADRTAVPSLQQMNDPAAHFVVTPNSPSEFLARVVIAHFNLPRLPEKWAIEAAGANAVYAQLNAARGNEKKAYVLWEPYVSKALAKPGMQVLLDSSKVKGYVVDVLVAQREFLRASPELVKAVIEGYLRASYTYNQANGGLPELIQADARASGAENLDEKQAGQIVAGIQWKNTLENYGHFGLNGTTENSLPLLEDMIGNIIDVLVRTKALPADPLAGKHEVLFYRQILADLRSASFHPGQGLLTGVDVPTGENEKVRSETALGELSAEQWQQLRPVGELRIEPIVFARGSADLTVQSERDLQDLARRLASYPLFYVRITGHTRAEGDAEANRLLAQSRAEAAARLLMAQGVPAARLRTSAAPAVVAGGEAQVVSFQVVQVPY